MRCLISGVVMCGTVASLGAQTPALKPPDAAEQALRALVAAAPQLPFDAAPLPVTPPTADFAMGMVSWVTSAKDGTTYLLQRGDKADPVIAVDPNGTVLRSWGKGLYVMPHAIRVDPQGNVWTADAASSHVIKYLARGKGAARDRRRRTTHALPEQLLQHDRYRVCRERPCLHQRRLRERARPRVQCRWPQGARMG